MKINFRMLQVGCLLFTLFLTSACHTQVVQSAIAQTAGNDPTIKKGDVYTYSPAVQPKLFDFISFLGEIPGMDKKYLMIYRLCGMPGDKVEIRSGELYINNILMDNQFKLKHNYLILKTEFEKIKHSVPIDANYSTDLKADTLVIPMDDDYVRRNMVNSKRLVLSKSFPDTVIANRFFHLWNQDNFGPITVPKESYFVLGDNRHNAWDSRYRGFIDKTDFLGTKILK
jgi:signal peptidase I